MPGASRTTAPIHAKTPKALKKYNKLGSITDMPFKAGAFDFVFETSLCHVAEKQVARAVREIQSRGQDRASCSAR